jgi:hypothetical protein
MSLSRSDTPVTWCAAAHTSAARAVPLIQRCDSLSAVTRERRGLAFFPCRFLTWASTSPSSAPVPASTARTACSRRPPKAPPLPTGPYPLARARRPPNTSSLVSWITITSRPATRVAAAAAAWAAISPAVTEALRKNRVNCISRARVPASLRTHEPGRRTSAACKTAPLFPAGGRQTAQARIQPQPSAAPYESSN